MNLASLRKELSEELDVTQREARTIIDTMIMCMSKGLKYDGKVQLTGFGSFHTRLMKDRVGRNPRKPDETFELEDKYQITFKSGKYIKEYVNGKE